MKKIVLFAFCCLIGFGLKAQSPINLGVHAGWNNTKIDVKNLKVKSHDGYMFGAFLRINMSRLYLEPSLNFVHKESEVDGNGIDSKIKYSAVDVPLMLGFYLVDASIFKLRGFAGPVVSFLTSDLKIKNVPDYLDSDKTMWNGKVGGGIDLWNITFDVAYEFGLKKFGDGVKAPSSVSLTLGLKIF